MTPPTLYPKKENTESNQIIKFLNDNADFCIILLLVILMILISVLFYLIFGGSATESGNYYNQLLRVV